MTYKIEGNTNVYTASRDAMFNGKTTIVLECCLTLKEAQKELLNLYNKMYRNERPTAKNWGLAVIQSKVEGANPTFQDGTRSFDYDGRTFSIEFDE